MSAIEDLYQAAIGDIRAWAARTRPLLSEPPEGQQWQVYIHPLTEDDIDLTSDDNTLKVRYEWVLVDVASAS